MSTKTSRIFVLGPTGAGKSTLIQFLGGCDFKFVPHPRRKLIKQLVPVDASKLKEKFQISEEMNSQTRGVHAMTLRPPLYHFSSPVIVVDTPGFKDTDGADQDVENFLLLHQHFLEAKESRFLFLTDSRGLVTVRGSGIKLLTEQISSLFDNRKTFNEVLSSITVAFTHITPGANLGDTKSDIMEILKEKLFAMKKDPRMNDLFLAEILEAIIAGRIKTVVIDESRLKREEFIEEILSRTGISSGFQYRMSLELREYINALAGRKYAELSRVVTGENKNFGKAMNLLNEIEKLSETSHEQETIALFHTASRLVDEIEETFSKTILDDIRKSIFIEFSEAKMLEQLKAMSILRSQRTKANEQLLELLTEFIEALTFENFSKLLAMEKKFAHLIDSVDHSEKETLDCGMGLMKVASERLCEKYRRESTDLFEEMRSQHVNVIDPEISVNWFTKISFLLDFEKRINTDVNFTQKHMLERATSWKDPEATLETYVTIVFPRILGSADYEKNSLRVLFKLCPWKKTFPNEFVTMEQELASRFTDNLNDLKRLYNDGTYASSWILEKLIIFENICMEYDFHTSDGAVRELRKYIATKEQAKKEEKEREEKLRREQEEQVRREQAARTAELEQNLAEQRRQNQEVQEQMRNLRRRSSGNGVGKFLMNAALTAAFFWL